MAQFHWDPATYRSLMRTEVPAYEEFQDEVAGATRDVSTRRVLDLGTGTGETASRVLALHEDAFLVGVDESREMLTMAHQTLPAWRVDLRVGRLSMWWCRLWPCTTSTVRARPICSDVSTACSAPVVGSFSETW
jgi:trans-aconitate methyltransferase